MSVARVDPEGPDVPVEPRRESRRTETERQMLHEVAVELGLRGPGSLIEARRRLPMIRRDTDWIERPKTRADCVDGPRPCPWAGCAHHPLIEVDEDTGHLRFPFGDLEIHELPYTCVLDEAAAGGLTLDEVGRRMGVVRERVRQIQDRAIRRIVTEISSENLR